MNTGLNVSGEIVDKWIAEVGQGNKE
jgi:hypothetical protein